MPPYTHQHSAIYWLQAMPTEMY